MGDEGSELLMVEEVKVIKEEDSLAVVQLNQGCFGVIEHMSAAC